MLGWCSIVLLLACAPTCNSFGFPPTHILGSLLCQSEAPFRSASIPRNTNDLSMPPAERSIAGNRMRISSEADSKSKKIVGHDQAASSVVFRCTSLEDWFTAESKEYKGFCLTRPSLRNSDSKLQQRVDTIEEGDERQETVSMARTSETDLTQALESAAGRLVESSQDNSPSRLAALLEEEPALKAQIKSDAVEIASAMIKLLPKASHVELKLKTFGEKVCSRWHRDYYWARSIVTYAGPSATLFAEDEGVNFAALEEKADNDQRIKGDDWVRSVGVGDVFMMKGSLYPNGPHAEPGLVHKSPEPEYHADGSVMRRLCLKVDCGVPSLW